MWWDEARIDATVTRQFVSDQLQPHEAELLDQDSGPGDGPAEGTYWGWIRDRAKRIFLILVDLGLPDQIFALVDDGWDEYEPPLSLPPYPPPLREYPLWDFSIQRPNDRVGSRLAAGLMCPMSEHTLTAVVQW